jgi:hypothetical protein
METANVPFAAGKKSGAGIGKGRQRGQASNAPAMPTGTTGAFARLINNRTPGRII